MKANKIVSLTVVLLFAVLAFVSAGADSESAATSLTGTISIAGSSTVYPITVAIAEEFNKLHPGVEIPVQSTGTSGGFKNFFIPGKTDINDASRPIKSSEVDEIKANGFDVIELQVATDALTVVVSPEADWVDSMTIEQLAKIWRPEDPAMKWSDVDPSWPNAPFELYGPTSASGTFEYFTEVVVGKALSSRSDYQGTEQDNTIVQAVGGSKYAMGYFGLAYYAENKGNLKAVKINGVEPSIETARAGAYTPLARPIFIYVSTKSLERPEVQEFVRYYIKQTNTSLISEIGYVPLTDAAMKANLDKFEKLVAGLK